GRSRVPRQSGGRDEPAAGPDRRTTRRRPARAPGLRHDDGAAGSHQGCQPRPRTSRLGNARGLNSDPPPTRRQEVDRVKVLVAPDKFKGSLSASEVADRLAEGLAAAGVDSYRMPLADGGDGSVDAALAAG